LIVGEKEAAGNQVSVRRQGEGDKGVMTIDEFIDFIKKEEKKSLP
jgi:threonyl-tRNA synthetase